MIKNIVDNPLLNCVIGLILIYSSGTEVWRDYQELGEMKIGAHHGVLLFGILHTLQILPDLFEGLEDMLKKE